MILIYIDYNWQFTVREGKGITLINIAPLFLGWRCLRGWGIFILEELP
jgi:hypothetical protein